METVGMPEADPHLLQFEVERYRPATRIEAKAGLVGGMLGFLDGMAAEHIIFGGDPDVHVPNPIRPLQSLAHPQFQLISPSSAPQPQHRMGQAEATALVAPSHTSPPVETQAGLVAGVTLSVAFAAAALSSAFRQWRYRRRVNFKADISEEELKELYEL